MPSFKCADIEGMESCAFSTKDKNMDKLMGKIAAHAKSAHGIETIDDDLMGKVKAVIKK
jgi:predicted small metal-binding protein